MSTMIEKLENIAVKYERDKMMQSDSEIEIDIWNDEEGDGKDYV